MILGCTHFPLLSGVIAKVLPAPVQVSAGEEAAKTMAEKVRSLSSRAGSGKDLFFTSDDPAAFRQNAATFLGRPLDGEVLRTDIETY
jgi:glutamate racemase